MIESFREKLENLINAHSMENGSDTPDFILAEFMADSLRAFDKATKERSRWYGHITRESPNLELDDTQHPVSCRLIRDADA